MYQSGERLFFDKRREFELTDVGCIYVSEALVVAEGLRQKSEKRYKDAFENPKEPGDMRAFNEASELLALAQKVESYAPQLRGKSIADYNAEIDDEFATLLDEAS
jgi:hypothetical protein